MANVVVKENHLTFGGVSYFRGHAEEIEIGSIGEKRTPLTKQNYLEVKDRIPVPKIAIAQATIVEIDFARTTKTAFTAAVAAIIKGIPIKISGDATFDKLRKGELKLVKFSVSNRNMEKAANSSPDKLRSLIDWGNDARIAHQIFVVIEAATATQFDNNVTVELSVGAKGLKAKVKGQSSVNGNSTIQISRGTGFAYLLLKPVWNAKQKKNKTTIIDSNDDQWGLN